MSQSPQTDPTSLSALRTYFKFLLRSDFVRSVSVLVSGTLVAQLIALATLPVVTRIYTPEHFNLLAVFAGLIGWIGAVACLRLELAVPLPDNDEDATSLMALALLMGAIVSAILAAAVLAAPETISHKLIRQPQLQPYLWLLPVGVFSFACFSALQMWFVRAKMFRGASIARVTQAGAAAGVQIGLGFQGIAPLGLLLGPITNTIMGTCALALLLGPRYMASLAKTRLAKMRALFVQYHKFPTFSTLETMSNVAALQLPMLIIAAVAPGPEAGYLLLATTVVLAPITLLGGAVSQVYMSRAADAYRTGDLPRLTTDVLEGLFRVGVGPLVFAGLVAPPVFAFVFGQQWMRSGELITWMTPWIVAQFLAIPLGMAYYATDRQGTSLIIQSLGFLARVALVLLAWKIAPRFVSEAFALGGLIFYLGLLGGVFVCIGSSPLTILKMLRNTGYILASWAAAGLIVRFVLEKIASWL